MNRSVYFFGYLGFMGNITIVDKDYMAYMGICICIYICVYIYICIYICIYIYMFMYMYVYIYVYTYVCMYMYMYIYIYICMYMYMYICICIYTEFWRNKCGIYDKFIDSWGDDMGNMFHFHQKYRTGSAGTCFSLSNPCFRCFQHTVTRSNEMIIPF